MYEKVKVSYLKLVQRGIDWHLNRAPSRFGEIRYWVKAGEGSKLQNLYGLLGMCRGDLAGKEREAGLPETTGNNNRAVSGRCCQWAPNG